jgi:hypothetical protein
MSDLSRDERALIDSARAAEDPDVAVRKRVRERLLVQIGAGMGATALSGTAAAGTGKLLVGSGLLTKLFVVGGAVALGGAAVVGSLPAETPLPVTGGALGTGARAVSAAPARALASAMASAMARSAVAAAEPAPSAAVSPARPVATSAAAASSVPRDGLAEEVALLGRAQQAMREGRADHALEILGEHDRRFGSGALAEEAQAARVLALCEAGRRAEARALGARFLARSPDSPLAARVRAACAP